MNKQELINIILSDFYEGFAASVAKLVISVGEVEPVYELAVGDFRGCEFAICEVRVRRNITQTADNEKLQQSPHEDVSYAQLPISQRNKVVFRSAYVLENIYFNYPNFFEPFRARFISDFPNTTNASAKRHFAKMMLHELRDENVRVALSAETCDKIAQASAHWIIEPKVAVAVQIWAFDVLLTLRDHVEWLDDLLPQITDILSRQPSAAMQVRLRRWKL